MRYFVQRSDGRYLVFEGMNQETITTMLAEQGFGAEFITEAAFQAVVAALQNI